MPVTLKINDNVVRGWSESRCSTAESLLENVDISRRRGVSSKDLVQTSLSPNDFDNGYISGSRNGFIWAAYHAYSAHHHLRIRPEDVWFAILTQITFYINAHAEELRSFFVAHEGKKRLRAVSDIRDFGRLSVQMGEMISDNVKDPTLKDWVLPGFSTTTPTDTVVGSVLFMGAMQKYFSFDGGVTCGLPSVTLLGDVGDWEDILGRLDKLDLLGDEPRQFADMLRPVLRSMIRSFAEPTSAEVITFWNTVVHQEELGSGTDSLSGWLMAFCYWDEYGKANGLPRDVKVLDGRVKYVVDVDKVPAGFASVPVSVDDGGEQYEATLVAGSVGILATSSTRVPAAERQEVKRFRKIAKLLLQKLKRTSSAPPPSLEGRGRGEAPTAEGRQGDTCETEGSMLNTVQPMSGWWMLRKN
ncbi:hypothetical protein KVR01_002354 [Diaporthe batatas]|uniref:uncharacterized protein n=1 Tax=Diaporthe batatas TaxID=748121 RepID=UPI001D03EAE6|nr:uncharacterized protein KVR01_002354 [Diaporthe batatas]KAG8166665.1 hypothetical protein KVR01_002354 [Diaporthe batatas]